jgi:hypothetical protein
MKKPILLLTAALVAVGLSCSDDPSAPDETISTPSTPAGEVTADTGEVKMWQSGGAASNVGHTIQYRFDTDASGVHEYSPWTALDSISVSWADTGLYEIRAQARCAEHGDKKSEWSAACSVTVVEPVETVSTPGLPSGTPDTQTGWNEEFCTAGAVSNFGHALEYQFDFDAAGVHDTTDWDSADCATHTWTSAGPYIVKTRARCAEHPDVISGWSQGKYVAVDLEIISAPWQIEGYWSSWPNVEERYCLDGATSDKGHTIEYQYDFDAGGAGDLTAWGTERCVTREWPATGTFDVRARARCAVHTAWVSSWCDAITVNVTELTELPRVQFATHIDGTSKAYTHSQIPRDTVAALEPLSISWHGVTPNRAITRYWYTPLSGGVDVPGSDVWYEDLADTLKTFTNTVDDLLPSGVVSFNFGARARDAAGAESSLNAGTFTEGVCRVVVNFDPDTRITDLQNTYTHGSGGERSRNIDFADGIPDTVSYKSWVRLRYLGWDDARDGKIECNDLEPDKCIGFQVAYNRTSTVPGAYEFSGWQPRNGVHDTDPFSSADSNSVNIPSAEMELFARAVDEHGRPDGTPPSVDVIGNFTPTLDSVVVADHLGNRLDLAVVDTVTWNFWKGEGWPYKDVTDTLELGGPEPKFVKTFSFNIRAWGRDHPWDPPGSGVKAWRYMVQNSQGAYIDLGRSTAGFFDGASIDVLDERIAVTFRYAITDTLGDAVFADLPSWFDDNLTCFLMGRDTAVFGEPEFYQYMFINGAQQTMNVFPAGTLGRRTAEKVFTFQVRLVR